MLTELRRALGFAKPCSTCAGSGYLRIPVSPGSQLRCGRARCLCACETTPGGKQPLRCNDDGCRHWRNRPLQRCCDCHGWGKR